MRGVIGIYQLSAKRGVVSGLDIRRDDFRLYETFNRAMLENVIAAFSGLRAGRRYTSDW